MTYFQNTVSDLAAFLQKNYRKAREIMSIWSPVRLVLAYQFKKNLVLLNDILATTALSGQYWVWCGLLLGWAREGRVLPWDTDADFFYFREDRDTFLRAADSLTQAGFKLKRRFVSNEGRVTEYVFVKHFRRFEFFEVEKQKKSLRYWLYAPQRQKRLEMIGVLPWNGDAATMDFLGRTWLIPSDHEALLTAMYGDWLTPNPAYNYVEDEKSIVAKYEWHGRIIPGMEEAMK